MGLEGKVALVTGAGSGIGRGIAMELARAGADISVNDKVPSSAAETAGAVVKLGRRAIAVAGDVGESPDVDRVIEKTIGELGGVHILVNNAGLPPTAIPTIEEPSEEAWDRVVRVILRGTYVFSQRAGQWMAKNGSGKIINISSICGIGGFPAHGAYGPAKAGVINLTRLLAVEWAGHNINVNCIAPGFVRTPMLQHGIDTGGVNLDGMLSRVPLRRLAEVEEIAKLALFLASEDSNFITGVTIPIDGGYLAGGYQGL